MKRSWLPMFDLVLWPMTAEFDEQYDEEMNIRLLESHLKMSKPRANVVSFDGNVSYLSTSMNLYERNEHFFYEQNSYWTDRTVQTLASLYNINLKMAGLCWSDNPNCCYKYNTLCQPRSSLWPNRELKHWRRRRHGRRLAKNGLKFYSRISWVTKPVQSANLSTNLLKLNM